MIRKESKIKGIKLVYYESGFGKPLLFFHGGRLRSLTHKNILFKLSKKYHVIAPDIPGYGESSTPKEVWSFQDYASFFDSFLKRMKIKEVIIVGYSLGGGIAYNLANISLIVKKLVLIDSAGIEKTTEKELIRDFKRVFFYLSNPKYFSVFINLVKEYILFTFNHLKDLNQIKNIRNNLNNSVSYIKNLEKPTLIIWAKDDNIFPLKIAQKLNKTIRDSKLTIVEGNHDWVLYDESRFIDVLNKALI